MKGPRPWRIAVLPPIIVTAACLSGSVPAEQPAATSHAPAVPTPAAAQAPAASPLPTPRQSPTPIANPYGVVDATTLERKLVFGYQGWFAAAGDGSPFGREWNHWSHKPGETPSPANLIVDMWPDLSEFDPDELYPTEMRYADGRVASVFSSWNAKTVHRHFKWMGEQGIDGVLLQRFHEPPIDPRAKEFRDGLALRVRSGAEAYGRVFALEYDISPPRQGSLFEQLRADWIHLVDDLRITESDRYLRHRGRPLLGIWGFAFPHVKETPEEMLAIVHWFTRDAPERYRVTLLGGVEWSWRQSTYGPVTRDARWPAALMAFDVISPWYVGALQPSDEEIVKFADEIVGPDLAAVKAAGKDFLPIVHPGFSWQNLMRQRNVTAKLNSVPRNGGKFWWKQLDEWLRVGVTMVKGAMFDEIDEGTAMFKLAPRRADAPVEPGFVTLDADGLTLPSDWYLRLAGAGTKVLRGLQPRTAEIPIRP